MDLYRPLLRSVIRRRSRALSLDDSQWLPLDQLRDLQARALVRLVRHAYDHVPFYRRWLDAAGLEPGDIRCADDLSKLPILRRAELRAAADRASTAPPWPTIRTKTSGITAEPLVVCYDAGSEQWRRAVAERAYAWAGYRPGDRVLFLRNAPDEETWPQRLERRLRREHHLHCGALSDERLGAAVRHIERAQPALLVCDARAGVELARFITRHGLRTWPALPVICRAERIQPHDREELAHAFGPAVFDTYGCREVTVIAAECEAHAGLHVAMEHLVVEIVVTEHGRERPARAGESGEVVITDLHNYGMPFIRYANGDVATAGAARRCPCGRTLPRIEAVQRRVAGDRLLSAIDLGVQLVPELPRDARRVVIAER